MVFYDFLSGCNDWEVNAFVEWLQEIFTAQMQRNVTSRSYNSLKKKEDNKIIQNNFHGSSTIVKVNIAEEAPTKGK